MKRLGALTGLVLMVVALAPAQDNSGTRVVVPPRNSSRPRLLKITMLHANMEVKTHAGKEVIVESTSGSGRRREERTPDGLRRIDIPMGGFNVEEDDNVITIHSQPNLGGTLTVTVPVDTSAGKLAYELNNGAGIKAVYLDDERLRGEELSGLSPEMSVGRHRITFVIDRAERGSTGLVFELKDAEGETGHAQLVGGR